MGDWALQGGVGVILERVSSELVSSALPVIL